MSSLRRVIYTSKATSDMGQAALLEILHTARDFNAADAVTGLLLHDSGYFLQVIEGPDRSITNLIERLKKDTRHEQFHIHEDVFTQERLFDGWKMGLGDLSDERLQFLPGIMNNSQDRERLFLLVDRIPELADRLKQALSTDG